MARTYGEILEASFPDVFQIASGPDTVFIDIGSGHGKIVVSAVKDFGCQHAIGIEKYRYALHAIGSSAWLYPTVHDGLYNHCLHKEPVSSPLPAQLLVFPGGIICFYIMNLTFVCCC